LHGCVLDLAEFAVSTRLVLSRLLFGGLLIIVLVTRHPFAGETTPAVVMELTGFMQLLLAAFGRTWAARFICAHKNSRLVMARAVLGGSAPGSRSNRWLPPRAGSLCSWSPHERAMEAEDRWLGARLGDRYLAMPARCLYLAARTVELDKRIFGRALLGPALILVVFLLAECIETGRAEGVLPGLLVLA